jgi:hypothetical protein
MNNADLFQKVADEVAATVGVADNPDRSVTLFHVLACAKDWCDLHGVDFDATLEEVREHFAFER